LLTIVLSAITLDGHVQMMVEVPLAVHQINVPTLPAVIPLRTHS